MTWFITEMVPLGVRNPLLPSFDNEGLPWVQSLFHKEAKVYVPHGSLWTRIWRRWFPNWDPSVMEDAAQVSSSNLCSPPQGTLAGSRVQCHNLWVLSRLEWVCFISWMWLYTIKMLELLKNVGRFVLGDNYPVTSGLLVKTITFYYVVVLP